MFSQRQKKNMSGITGSSDGPSYHEYRSVKVLCQSKFGRTNSPAGFSVSTPMEPGGFNCELCAMESSVDYRQSMVVGKVLTTLEASITNEVQLKAMKDLIKNTFYTEFEELKNDAGYAIANSQNLRSQIIK